MTIEEFLESDSAELSYPEEEKADDREKINEVYGKYHALVNMSANELEKWSETECSHRASVDRTPISRNLKLLKTDKADWTEKDKKQANRTISFISRMKKMPAGKPVKEGCPSKRDISLKNWAYDPNKKAMKETTHQPLVQSKALVSDFTINEEERSVTQYISTKDEDRGNDVMIPDGVKLTNYKVNPIVLWGHNQRELPIAKALWTKPDAKGVLSKAQFAKHQFAEDAWQLVKDKFVNATSIGYVPLKEESKETGKFREIWGMKIPITKRIIHEWELLEWSYVNVPMNPKALVQRDFSGLDIKSAEMKNFLLQEAEKYTSIKMDEQTKEEFKALLEGFKSEMEASVSKAVADAEEAKSQIVKVATNLETFITNHNSVSKTISEIAGEIKSIKDAKQKEALEKLADEMATGAIRKQMGKVDYLFNQN